MGPETPGQGTGSADERERHVDDILAFVRRRPPFVSVYLRSDTASEDGRQQLGTEWDRRRGDLAAQGASEHLLDAIDAVISDHRRSGGLAVLADGDGDILYRALPEAPRDESAHLGPLPRVGPLLAEARAMTPHVIVLVDRLGADIVAVVDGEREDLGAVVGDADPLHKVPGGGWSHRRYQQRAENTWEHNAAGVATEVAERARAIDAVVVVAAGDERALGFLDKHLPDDVRARLHVSSHGGRAAGVDEEPLLKEVRHVVADADARRTVEALERFGELRGRGGAVADGPGETFGALREALVDRLLLHTDTGDDRTAWFSASAPTLVALEARTLRDLGVEPVEDRLADVAIWSAVGSGGSVQLVPAHGPSTPLEGIGARLRGGVAGRT
jgi:hypothetical protein